MKDYSSNREEAKEFILSYKIFNNEIISKLACGEYYTIPYSIENENKIISKMEEQAKQLKIEPITFFDILFSISSLTLSFGSFCNLLKNDDWRYGLLTSGFVLITCYYLSEIKRKKSKIKDIEKLNFFLENKEILELLKIYNSKINSENKNSGLININNIDHYSLKDLKHFKEDILNITIEEFGLRKTLSRDE